MRRLIFALLALLAFSGCGGSEVEALSQRLDLPIRQEMLVTYTDTHGGFHGDGYLFAEMQDTEEETLYVALLRRDDWQEGPADDGFRRLMFGGYVTDQSRQPFFGEPSGDYLWYFHDRHSDANGSDASAAMERPSLNFDAGVYDPETGKLYFVAFDT